MRSFSKEFPCFLPHHLGPNLCIQIFDIINENILDDSHAIDLLVIWFWGLSLFICVFFVLLENLPLCCHIGISHLCDVNNLDVRILDISKEERQDIFL